MNPVQLHDGRTVDSSSEEWRLECEARAVLEMPTRAARRKYLFNVEERRGVVAMELLRQRIMAIYEAMKAERGAG